MEPVWWTGSWLLRALSRSLLRSLILLSCPVLFRFITQSGPLAQNRGGQKVPDSLQSLHHPLLARVGITLTHTSTCSRPTAEDKEEEEEEVEMCPSRV